MTTSTFLGAYLLTAYTYRFQVLQLISQMFNSSFNIDKSLIGSFLTVFCIGAAD